MATDRTMNDYFFPPHGGRPPSDEAVAKATRRYVEEERARIATNQQSKGKST